MIWYKKIGFNSNPFSIKPAAFQPEVVAYDLDFIYEKIESAEILFIEGQYGTGKTTILKSMISRFKDSNKIIYYSFNDGKNFNLVSLLNGANSMLRRITGLKHRNIILLLDEVHTMTKGQAREILKYYQNGTIQSVVFVTHDYSKVNLPEDLQLYLEGNVIETVSLSQKEAIELVESRIGDINLFTKKILARIFLIADKNPRRFLEYCEDVARYAVGMEDYKVSDFHVDNVLEDVIKEQEKQQKQSPVVNKQIKKQVVAKEKKTEEPKIEIKEIEPKQVELNEDSEKSKKEKKFKVNKLVEGSKDPLGTVEAKLPENESEAQEEPSSTDEIPEYKVFVFENN